MTEIIKVEGSFVKPQRNRAKLERTKGPVTRDTQTASLVTRAYRVETKMYISSLWLATTSMEISDFQAGLEMNEAETDEWKSSSSIHRSDAFSDYRALL